MMLYLYADTELFPDFTSCRMSYNTQGSIRLGILPRTLDESLFQGNNQSPGYIFLAQGHTTKQQQT